jgi:hypothetical protein
MIILFGDSHTASFVIDSNKKYMTPEEEIIKKCFNSFRTWHYTLICGYPFTFGW